jgi:hypothetical protein
VAAAVLLGGLAPSHARADEPSPENGALAAALFQEGRKLLEENRVSEACRKFDESQRLDPGGGTLLNLAACHEREGRAASAWAEFEEALANARRDGRADRVQVATQRIAALERRVAHVTIAVPAGSDRADLEVTLDGTPVRRPAWGLGVPVDPGDHTVEARAPGATAWRATVTIHGEAEEQSVSVPALEPLPVVVTVPVSPPAAVAALPQQMPPAAPPERAERRGVPLWRDATMVGSAAVGVAGIALGSYFGLHAIALNHDAADGCPGGRCTNGAATTSDRATSSADASTVSFAVGAAGIGAAVVLLITRGAGEVPVTAGIERRGAGFAWKARF